MTFELPRLKAAGISIPEYETKKQEIMEQSRALRMVESKIRQLEGSLETARNADMRAAIEAKRKGSKDPGPKNVRRVERQLEAGKREREVLDVLVAELEAEAHSIVAEHQADIRRGLQEAIRERNASQREAVRTIEATRSERRELKRTLDLIARLAPGLQLEMISSSGRDTFELAFAPASWLPNDDEIRRVFALLKAECGDAAELEAIREQEHGSIDISAPPGGGLLPHPVVGHVEERKAAASEAGDGAA